MTFRCAAFCRRTLRVSSWPAVASPARTKPILPTASCLFPWRPVRPRAPVLLLPPNQANFRAKFPPRKCRPNWCAKERTWARRIQSKRHRTYSSNGDQGVQVLRRRRDRGLPLTPRRKGCLHEYHPGPYSAGIADRRDTHTCHTPAVELYRRPLSDHHRTDRTLRRRQLSLLIRSQRHQLQRSQRARFTHSRADPRSRGTAQRPS